MIGSSCRSCYILPTGDKIQDFQGCVPMPGMQIVQYAELMGITILYTVVHIQNTYIFIHIDSLIHLYPAGDEVSMLTHIYPHNPGGKSSDHLKSPG